MTRDDIIRMAREAGGTVMQPYDYGATPDRMILRYEVLERFAALVAAHEREACKKQVESLENRIAELERGEILTDKELVGAVIQCVMSVTQSNRDLHCRKLQRHIIAVENERDAREEECERADKLIVSLRKQIAAEREACAKVCDSLEAQAWNNYKRGPTDGSTGRADPTMMGRADGASECAAAIRARGATENGA